MNTWFIIIIMILLLSAAFGAISAAPWVPTKRRDVARMVALADIKSEETIYDLGCGDGRLLFASAKQGAKGVGIEVFLLPYLVAKIRSWFYPGVKIKYGNFFRHNISQADVVFIFLMAGAYDKLIKKFEQELRPGTRLVVYCFAIKKWQNKLVKIDKPNGILPIYLYII